MKVLLFILFCGLLCHFVAGTDIVASSGLRQAIESAQDGDTIVIPTGTYFGADNTNFTLYGRNLTFISQSGAYQDVIIDCGGINTNVSAFIVRYQFYNDSSLIPPFTSNEDNATTILSFSGITFSNCANALYLNTTNTTGNATISISKSRFTQNIDQLGRRGNIGGAGIYAEGAYLDVYITDSVFDSNNATYGGAIYAIKSSYFNIKNTFFSGNRARNSGGAIGLHDNSYLDISNSMLTGNLARNEGGAIDIDYYAVTNAENCNYTKNVAYVSGGAINLETAQSWFRNSFFVDNAAPVGGAVYTSAAYSAAVIDYCELNGNTAEAYGGAVAARSSGHAYISYSRMNSNIAYIGGAVASMISGYILVSNSNVTYNVAGNNGGAFYVQDLSTINVQSSIVEHNSAKENGDTLYCLNSAITFNSTEVVVDKPNEAEQNGVYCEAIPDYTWCRINAMNSGNWTDTCNNQPKTTVKSGMAGWKIALIIVGSILGALLLGFAIAYAIASRFEAPTNAMKLTDRDRSDTVLYEA